MCLCMGDTRQFPRFYFMSEADLLDLLSNSSQPAKVLVHIDKILLATKVGNHFADVSRSAAGHALRGWCRTGDHQV
jgi:Dynein heavy chain, N-terminal region 2